MNRPDIHKRKYIKKDGNAEHNYYYYYNVHTVVLLGK